MIIVSQIEAYIEHREYVYRELKKLLIPTILEKGCIQYDLHIDTTNSNIFLLYEQWQTRNDYIEHMKNIHIVQYKKNTKQCIKNEYNKEMCLIK